MLNKESTATQGIGQDGKALLAPYTVFEREWAFKMPSC